MSTMHVLDPMKLQRKMEKEFSLIKKFSSAGVSIKVEKVSLAAKLNVIKSKNKKQKIEKLITK